MRLLTRRAPPPPRARRPATDPAPEEERQTGCGWFDSSHDLQCGLQVTEHASSEAVVNLVPMSWWLAWELDAVMQASPRETTRFAQVVSPAR